MKKLHLILFLLSISFTSYSQEIYTSKDLNISFYSSTPVEDIEGVTKKATGVFDSKKKDFVFLIKIRSFTFDKSLMQEHFNENYMESDKYPNAQFNCKLVDNIDFTKNGTYKINVIGKLSIHGVERERTIPGTITIKDGSFLINCEFDVLCKDHDIKIPTLLTEKIAENIKVKVNGEFTKFKKV